MPPVFESENFIFLDGEEIPDHIEDYPEWHQKNERKWHLDGYDTFDGTTYTLAINIDSKRVATMLHQARLRELEKTQPTASSGGQRGIQDKVFIRPPKNR